jgi:ribosomal protein L37AE/L43A
MQDKPNYWQRRRGGGTSSRRAAGANAVTLAGHRGNPKRYDSQGRPYGKNKDGVAYTVCPMCSQRLSVRYPNQDFWSCEGCGYKDNEIQALN